MTRHGWGAFVITLGAWELIAYTGRLPTITSTYHRCRSRRNTLTTIGYVVWAGLLWRHLHRYLEDAGT